MLRQKRTTVGLLTRANSAKVRTGNRANAAGSSSTNWATRCSAGASEGREAAIRSSMANQRATGAEQRGQIVQNNPCSRAI